jgi:tetratricopeptide (TPR) repeat protein
MLFTLSNHSEENNMQIRSHLGRCSALAVLAGLLTICQVAVAMAQEPMAYIEPWYGPRFFPGDEDTRRGQAHLLAGDYGLAEQDYRRAVEATHQNGAAWIGLAASYDRLGRFGLADRAYWHAIRIQGENYVILNNRGYSYALRGDIPQARRLLDRAWQLAPGDPTIANNIAVLDAGQYYFRGTQP